MTTDPNTTSSITRSPREYYTALHSAALIISSSLELDQVLQSVVKSITEAMQVKACGLRLLDASTGQLEMSAVYGLSGSYMAKGPVDIERSPVDNEVMGGSTVYIADVGNDTRFQYQDAAKKEGLVSVLCVPLEVRGSSIGVLRVYTDTRTTFNEEDKQFLSILASLSALAIENARLYESIKSSYNGIMDAFWGTNVSS